mmetsp:Transcript_7306/g.18108  ORF Transcript_7306/g.18108 Transcript_7306/m.18108 type:complete len:106 (-) Transcript_7306:1694-2011(-)
MSARKPTSVAAYALPFIGFMIAGWFGLATVVQSKRDVRNATRGIDLMEELDPMERMRRRYGLEGGDTAATSKPEISSLEEELEATLKKINLKDFEYMPVPRTDDE